MVVFWDDACNNLLREHLLYNDELLNNISLQKDPLM